MKKYYYFIFPIYIFFYIQIVLFYFKPSYELFVDYGYYISAVNRFWSNQSLYQNNFVYFPSFFILTPILLDFFVYLIVLIISLGICIYLLHKLKEPFWMVLFTILLAVLYSYNGNIDPFIFMLILVCLKFSKKYELLAPILLSFIAFKPNIILIVPYFLYISKNRKKFMLAFGLSFILLNFYLILRFETLEQMIQFIFFEWHQTHFMDYIRPYWLYFVYYFGLKDKYKKAVYFKIN